MKIVFLHPRFPGQFIHLVRILASDSNNEVVFLAQNRREDIEIPGVRLVKVDNKKLPESMHPAEKALTANFYTGEVYGAAMQKLAKDGFYPDVIYDHPGWGCGMYAQDIFPLAARICFGEWFYTKGADYAFFARGKQRPPATFAASRQRNLCQLDALKDCDAIISPTHWQASQYPVEFAYKLRVIHDGVDTDFFSPRPASLSNGDEVEDSTIQA